METEAIIQGHVDVAGVESLAQGRLAGPGRRTGLMPMRASEARRQRSAPGRGVMGNGSTGGFRERRSVRLRSGRSVPRGRCHYQCEGLAPRLQLATVPAGFGDGLLAGGLVSPTAMEFAPDGRLFVAEKSGAVRIIKDGALLD